MVAEVSRTGTTAQQAVHSGHVAGDFCAYVFGDFQRLHLLADGFGQSRSRFACRCSQANSQRMTSLHRWRLQQRKQAHHCGGFAGARATGDDTECTAGSEGTGEFLPVDHLIGFGRTEQLIEPLWQVIRRRLTLG